MKVYLLWHVHELTDDFGSHDEEKLLGVFSTVERANDAIECFKNLEGFKDYPLNCFVTDEYEVDKAMWTEGFFTSRCGE
ncbi:MAG: hypothetical protein NC299_04600 [Lachnospiraceae bacterium]|nr:hypothetical protein [Ruminococcus sp.]MCM1274629.1 hypothetical protein [Lachnospiraceae bacterium]